MRKVTVMYWRVDKAKVILIFEFPVVLYFDLFLLNLTMK